MESLRKKQWKHDTIFPEVLQVYRADADDEPSVKFWTHETKLGREELTDSPEKGKSALAAADAGILHQLRPESFSSMRSLQKAVIIPRATIDRHLTQSLGMETRNLKWVRHVLTDNLRETVHPFSGSVKMLQAQNKIVVCDIKTGDGSWILFDEGPGSIWSSSEQQAPARLRLTIAPEKRIPVIF